ncbi:motility protein A [bacterium E08(2017)]|nr:motility protein A [bacterium E08(2017)]
MDLGTIIGLILAFGLVLGSIAAGGAAMAFVNVPSMMVTVGGSMAAVLINFPLPKIIGVMGVVRKAFSYKNEDTLGLYRQISDFAVRARRDGILALEDDIENIEDEFMKKGFQMAVDGNAADVIRHVLEGDIDSMIERHTVGHGIFKQLGAFAPAFGMIGTLIGLVQMLQALDDPSQIGVGMAVALLTTLYGAVVANLLALPIAGKLEQRTNEEVSLRRMVLEGMLSIQEGNSPRVVQEKLRSFMPPKLREEAESE